MCLKSGVARNFITCVQCNCSGKSGKRFAVRSNTIIGFALVHVVCLHYSPELVELLIQSDDAWLCWECKTCVACGLPSYYGTKRDRAGGSLEESSAVACSSCDTLYHVKCLPSRPSVGARKRYINWICSKCSERLKKGTQLSLSYLREQRKAIQNSQVSPSTTSRLLSQFSNSSKSCESYTTHSEDSNSSHPSVDQLSLPKCNAGVIKVRPTEAVEKPRELVDGLTSFFMPSGSRRTTLKTDKNFLSLQKCWGTQWTANNLKKKYLKSSSVNRSLKRNRPLASGSSRGVNGLLDGLSHLYQVENGSAASAKNTTKNRRKVINARKLSLQLFF